MPSRLPPPLEEKQIEKIAVKHETFGFGEVNPKGYTTHGFDPDALQAFVQELITERDRQWKELLRQNGRG